MSFNTHNNNDQISNTTYSSYSFSNPEFMGGSKLSFAQHGGRSPKFILRTTQKTNTHGIAIETEMSTVVDNNTQQIDSHHNNT